MKSTAAWAIAPLQDLLGLGTEARMNRPSTLGGNWCWRMAERSLAPEAAAGLKELAGLYGRCAAPR
jgi:4-alpha-glucanotransferase